MTDPLDSALDAAMRTIQAVDQQLAAARDANARLTAQLVAAELREKMLTDQVGLQADRIESLEAVVRDYRNATVQLTEQLIDALGLTERYETRIAALRAGGPS